MNELRKLEKKVNGFEVLLSKYPEEAKKNKDGYIQDLEVLIDFIDDYIKFLSEKLQEWYSVNISIFEVTTTNIFFDVSKKIDTIIVEHYLKKYSKEMLKAESLQKRLKVIEKRFMQFKYFS